MLGEIPREEVSPAPAGPAAPKPCGRILLEGRHQPVFVAASKVDLRGANTTDQTMGP